MKKALALTLMISISISGVTQAEAGAAANPYGTATIDPAAPNEIILTLSKGSRTTSFAYPRLLKLKQSKITVYEPFVKKRQTFTVVRLDALFTFVGISANDKVITKALNDYIFTAKASDFISAHAYLAIKRDGKPIGYDQGGPIRIIFADNSKWAKNLDAWNWSIASISVR